MNVKVNDGVILIHESVGRSLIKDAGAFATIAGLVVVGVALDSAALQWVGALMGFTAVCFSASGARKRCTYTIAEARAKLDELEARA